MQAKPSSGRSANIEAILISRWPAALLPLAFIGITYFSLDGLYRRQLDMDGFYHFAVSRMTVEEGLVRRLPQAEDIPWREEFADKEFLFHQLTALAYRIAGADGVVLACRLLAGLALWAVFLNLAVFLDEAKALAALLLLLLMDNFFMMRLFMVRPHILAIGLFFTMTLGILKGRPLVAGIGACLFAQAYHAWYLPLTIVAAGFLVSGGMGGKWRRSLLWALSGLGAGVVLNPYFPGHLQIMWDTLRIAVISTAAPAIGEELRVPDIRTALTYYKFHFLIMGAGLLALVRGAIPEPARAKEPEAQRPMGLFLWLSAMAFAAMTFRNFRGIEYWVPLTGILGAHLLRRYGMDGPRFWRFWPVALLLNLPTSYGFYRDFRNQRNVPLKELQQAVLSLAPESKGRKVYNCTFDLSPLVFFHRPDMRFVDIIDPSYMAFSNRDLSKLRDKLTAGVLVDPYRAMRGAFKADYALCHDARLILQMEYDPRFRRVHPRDFHPERSPAALYELAQTQHPAFVQSLLTKEVAAPGGSGRCLLARPAREELRRRAGALYLGLGGMGAVEVALDGRNLRYKKRSINVDSMVNDLLRLPEPLRPDSRLELRVCPDASGRSLLIASLWKPQDIERYCREGRHPRPELAKYFARLRSTYSISVNLCDAADPR